MNGTRSGDQGVRAQLTALAIVLVALWSYAAYLTGQDAADLLRVRALAQSLGQPTDRLILDLQAERRLTAHPTRPPDRPAAQAPTARNCR